MSQTPPVETAVSDQLDKEKIRLLYSQNATVLAGAIAVALAACYALWDAANHTVLLTWLAANVLLLVIRVYVLSEYRRRTANQDALNLNRWGQFYTAGALGTGILWGMCFLLFFPSDPNTLSTLFVMHSGYTAIAVLATSTYMPSFLAFVLSASLLTIAATLYHGGTEQLLIAILALFYMVMICLFAIRQNRTITEQIQLRMDNAELLKAVRKQRDRAEQAMLAKNRFLAAASHDLRQPVHALGFFIGSMEQHLTTDKSKSILNKIKQSTEALSDLFHGLLDISKLDAGVIDNTPRHFHISKLLTRLEPEYHQLAKQKNLKLKLDKDNQAIVFADSSLLERILRNLLSNAIKYTEIGSVAVWLKSDASDRTLQISVHDTGRGIPATEHENIFSEYHQLENTERDRNKGLGLGLAIVRRTCELMGLDIVLQSSPGNGSTFTLTVPAGIASDVAVTPEPVSPEIVNGSTKTVLIVDDEDPILEGMRELLLSWHCRVIAASSTEAALESIADIDHLDAIVADFRLTNNDTGLETIQRVRSRLSLDIPAMLITGDIAPERLRQASDAGIRMLHKPVDTSLFQRELQNLTRSHAATA